MVINPVILKVIGYFFINLFFKKKIQILIMNNTTSIINKLTVFALLLTTICCFYACEEDAVSSSDDCAVNITDLSLSQTTFAANSDLTGSVRISESIGLDDFVLRDIVTFYLSDDNSFSSDDTRLTVFADSPTSSGNTTTVGLNSIAIPSVSSGNYFILGHISSRPCDLGDDIPAETYSIAVTVQ